MNSEISMSNSCPVFTNTAMSSKTYWKRKNQYFSITLRSMTSLWRCMPQTGSSVSLPP